MRPLSRSISRLAAVAMGDRKADLIIQNCSLVSVYTGEVIEGTEIAVSGDRIAYVGPDASHARGAGTVIHNAQGRYAAPGFADPHIHVDQFVTPAELAAQSVLHGTTSLFSDPIDMVGVAGYRGFRTLMNMSKDLPARFFHVVPGGLPVDGRFSHSNTLSPEEERSAIGLPDVLGMGEVFSWTKVTSRDPGTMRSIGTMLDGGCIINGHTAGASGKKLSAYVSAGILSCHEPVNAEQAEERLRLGMWVMMREGSIRRDLAEILPPMLKKEAGLDRLMFCTDGIDPVDMGEKGHIDHCVREAVRLGADPVRAIAMASRNCFDYYNMARDLGGISPGRIADIQMLYDLESFRPEDVFVGGNRMVSGGKLVSRQHPVKAPSWTRRTIRLGRLTAADFAVHSRKKTEQVNTITMKTEIITEQGSAELSVKEGNVEPSRDSDVWKVAAFDRLSGNGGRTVGFLENFGADIGALASSWSFHENDLVVLGSSEIEMAKAANAVMDKGGGIAVVQKGRVSAMLPLQICGIISSDPFGKVSEGLSKLTSVMTDAGCTFQRPHLVPVFLPFLALPSVRILYSGMVDVRRRSYIPVIAGARTASQRPKTLRNIKKGPKSVR
ncbi:adenine deaminase [Cenarchaeum symbiosum A]|uniref:Adenine deaminase n=1 Tax=Cenarchaeum symbiosum (strain A) TaxID=414004 RepID=ADEC_CENSY|nr:RecName: Full=Adenine deaminase; Short=Adenase; Short=Adenine aminase [Cenarchaeum symbiosum A]ABK78604.1 adenine deaminase [Cenarchaeum symbiosum A]